MKCWKTWAGKLLRLVVRKMVNSIPLGRLPNEILMDCTVDSLRLLNL